MLKSFASGLHEEWSKPVDKCFGLLSLFGNHKLPPLRVTIGIVACRGLSRWG